MLNAALGGGTSSRLFQEVREQRGLAYTIYSFGSQHVDGGYFAIGGACTPRNLPDVLAICRDELAKVASAGLTVEEFERGKGQLRGSLVMGLEDSSSRMTRIGKAELIPGGLLSIDETLAKINAVTLDHVHAVAQELLDRRADPSRPRSRQSRQQAPLTLLRREWNPGSSTLNAGREEKLMTKRFVIVKPSDKAAAQLKVKLAAMEGKTPSPAVVKIANAQPLPKDTVVTR